MRINCLFLFILYIAHNSTVFAQQSQPSSQPSTDPFSMPVSVVNTIQPYTFSVSDLPENLKREVAEIPLPPLEPFKKINHPRRALTLSLGLTFYSYASLGLSVMGVALDNRVFNSAPFILGTLSMSFVGIPTAPSLGYIYIGQWKKAVKHSLLRVASGGVVSSSVLLYILLHEDDEGDLGGGVFWVATAAAGVGSFAFLTVYDIVDAPFAAKRVQQGLPPRNMFPLIQKKPKFSLLPSVFPGQSRASLGLSLTLKF